jgi:hypothetical protein
MLSHVQMPKPIKEMNAQRNVVMRQGKFFVELRTTGARAGYYIGNGKASSWFASANDTEQEVEDEFKRFVRLATELEM